MYAQVAQLFHYKIIFLSSEHHMWYDIGVAEGVGQRKGRCAYSLSKVE